MLPDAINLSYSVDYFGSGLSRTATEENLCWSDFNEKIVKTIDFYLLDQDQNVTFCYRFSADNSNDCNISHSFLLLEKSRLSDIGLPISTFRSASSIALVANYEDKLLPVGSDFNKFKIQGIIPDTRQNTFVMVGFYDLQANPVSQFKDITIPIHRVAAKIRLRLKNSDGNWIPSSQFFSILCRFADSASALDDPIFPDFTLGNKSAEIYPANVDLSGLFGNSDWNYPEDITTTHNVVKDEGHVYYSYPVDWIDYSIITNQCPRDDRDGHKGHNADKNHFTVKNYDDTPPIKSEREVFLIVKATYDGVNYFYKVPVNYRLAKINDQQCFTSEDLKTEIFPLYRLQRNHFYDVVATIDRPGATSLHATFFLSVVPYIDGGAFDYIYDPDPQP